MQVQSKGKTNLLIVTLKHHVKLNEPYKDAYKET